MSKLDRLDHTARSEEASVAIIDKGLKIGRWVQVGSHEYKIVYIDMDSFLVKLETADGGEMYLKAKNVPEAFDKEE